MSARVTPQVHTSREHVKARFRPFFVAVRAAADRYQGGITALAQIQGRNAQVMANSLNPNYADATPSADMLLSTFELLQPVEAVNYLALMCGRTTVPIGTACSPQEAMQAFLQLSGAVADATKEASTDLQDGRLDPDERARLLPLLDQLITAAVEFRAVVQS